MRMTGRAIYCTKMIWINTWRSFSQIHIIKRPGLKIYKPERFANYKINCLSNSPLDYTESLSEKEHYQTYLVQREILSEFHVH